MLPTSTPNRLEGKRQPNSGTARLCQLVFGQRRRRNDSTSRSRYVEAAADADADVLAGVDAGADAGVDAGGDGGGGAGEDAVGGAEVDVDADGDAEVDLEAVGDGEDEAGDGLGDADGEWEVRADALAGWDAPWYDDALAEVDAFREADCEADRPGAPPRPPAPDGCGEDVSAAGDGTGVAVCPPRAVTVRPAAAPAAMTPPMISASGLRERRGGRFRPPGGGGPYGPPEGCIGPEGCMGPEGCVAPGAGVMLFEVAAIELFEVAAIEWLGGAARSMLSPLGTCAPEPAAVVRVAPNPSAAPNPAAAPAAPAAAPPANAR